MTPENVTLFLWEHVLTRPNAQSEAGKKRRKTRKTAEPEVEETVAPIFEGELEEEDDEEELDPEEVERRGRLSAVEMSGLGEIAANAVYSRGGMAGMLSGNALSEGQRLGELLRILQIELWANHYRIGDAAFEGDRADPKLHKAVPGGSGRFVETTEERGLQQPPVSTRRASAVTAASDDQNDGEKEA